VAVNILLLKNTSLLKTGIIGTILTALCCFTPALVVILSAAGFSVVIGYLDFILMPLLVIFVLICLIAFWKNQQVSH